MTSTGLEPPAGRQGPGPIAGRLLQALDLSLVRRGGGVLPGEHPTPGVGAGTELAQLREYQPGDDVRQLEPAATARTQVPHVRLHIPERLVTTWIVLDVSPSMAFGTSDRLKSDVAEGVVGVLGRIATRRGGRVALLTFGGPTDRILPPRGGRGASVAVERVLKEGVARDGHEDSGALARALQRVGRITRMPGLVVIVSDFRGEPRWRREARALSGRHSVAAVEIRDPREGSLPAVGHLTLVDPETGRHVDVDTSDARIRRRFTEREHSEREAVRTELRRARIDHVVLSTHGDWLQELGRAFR